MSYSVKSPAPLLAKLIGVILWSGYAAAGTVACARAVGKKERSDLWPPAVAGAAVGCIGMSVHVYRGNATVGQCVVAPLIGGVVSAVFYGIWDSVDIADAGSGFELLVTFVVSFLCGILPAAKMTGL